MREGRVIAMAGLFQAVALVRQVALRGSCDADAMRQSLLSVFRIDADTAADVYGGVGNLSLGLKTLVDQLDERGKRDLAITRIAVTVLRLQKTLSRRGDILTTLHDRIVAMSAIAEQAQSAQVDPSGRLAQLYSETLSHLQPRVMVVGNPNYLNQPVQVDQIRALLLAAVRAAVLWRQLGGSHWRLLFRRRQYAMLARGLLARCTLDGQ
ncbi:MAG: high frequency lysogenization protein HflD [Rudaea sp.]